MSTQKAGSDFYREYDLAAARRRGLIKTPAPHQSDALKKLRAWHESTKAGPRGAILVLPTGGGKTFTAGRFMCSGPLSDGFKVLWLAHTHHLLEQAFFGFDDLVGVVSEPKEKLNVRVVSATVGHFPVHSIRASDDVVIASLQTARNAVSNKHEALDKFLDASEGKLLVAFDEAHHSPAPSYRQLILSLRDRCPEMRLLGLTATPTYGDEKKAGWLLRLFPQGIVYQAEPNKLMAAGILSRPIFEESNTLIQPDFEDREYQTWVDTHQDVPENVITTLAETRERNDRIVGHYVENRNKYGKTLVFADRWYQCDYIREALIERGVRADVVYSHVDADPGRAEARNRRAASENAQVIRRFRKGELDVLINVRMLTEGTDVPDVQTVFLTRQTTSRILMTQMVGRALRGSKFGGTDEAFIVSFIDNWKHHINWAAYDQLTPGLADDSTPEYGKRPPLQLISIDLVRRLARQMDSGINVNPAPYRTFLPVGWYRVEYSAQVEGSDDIELVGQLVMVFEDEKPHFERFIEALKKVDLNAFESNAVSKSDVRGQLNSWQQEFFADAGERVGGDLTGDLLSVVRHVAQNEWQAPKFFPFEDREHHDLDVIAQDFYARDLGPRETDDSLRGQYERRDRLWQVIYFNYHLFKSHFDACINRILDARQHEANPEDHRPIYIRPEQAPDREPSEELKSQVKSRDGNCCLCCGNRKQLQVDHISSFYSGGSNQLDNLQSLCRPCNQAKGIERISFRVNKTPLSIEPGRLPRIKTPSGVEARSHEHWEKYLRRTVNLFYRCSAVESVEIGQKGHRFRHWDVRLFKGNDEKWLDPHLNDLINRIREARLKAGRQAAPDTIRVSS
jgi:ATP-dependent helicase IRC3